MTDWLTVPVGQYHKNKKFTVLHDTITTFGGFVAGGFVRHMCSSPSIIGENDPITDIDVYFPDEEAFEHTCKLLEHRMALFGKPMDTLYSKTYHCYFHFNRFKGKQCTPIQFIKPKEQKGVPLGGTRTEILETFDFTVCQAALLPNGKEALVSVKFLEDNVNKFLRFNIVNWLISSSVYTPVGRLCRYYEKGFWTNKWEFLKILGDWTKEEKYRKIVIDIFQKGDNEKLTKKEIKSLWDVTVGRESAGTALDTLLR